MLSKAGFWHLKPYHRLSVAEFVEEWVGWKPLVELVELMPETWILERGFIAALFLTGGRVSEVLALKAENFEVRKTEGLIIVRGMPLYKRYRKIAEQPAVGRRKWITERLEKTRKPFPIPLNEPLVPYLLQLLEATREGLLFPSPRKAGKPLSRFWAYKLIRSLDAAVPDGLRHRLGLDKAFVKDGKRIADRLHLWLHWFRAQRASQLVADYGFGLHDLLDFFSWEHLGTALTYSRKGWKGLAVKMLEVGSHAR
ncbi:MAG: hypothetical protein QXH40_03825 [Candidatus Bathyarchaeia archaeon]